MLKENVQYDNPEQAAKQYSDKFEMTPEQEKRLDEHIRAAVEWHTDALLRARKNGASKEVIDAIKRNMKAAQTVVTERT